MVILELLGIACMAVFISELSGIMNTVKAALSKLGCRRFNKPFARIKPLDCPLCLGYWLGLGYFAFIRPAGLDGVLLFPFITSVLATYIIKSVRP